MTDKPRWTLSGTVLVACNCDYGCPCNFNARPSRGHCEGGWMWMVREGAFDGVTLDGLTFAVFVKWPGAIHEGNGEAIILVDERGDERQREAIATLVEGQHGGPWGTLAWTWPTVHGPKPVPFDVTIDGVATRVKAGDSVVVHSTTIRNPVSGAEMHPGILLPEGIILKKADLGCSAAFKVTDSVPMDHTGQYTAVGAFEYSGA